MACSDCGSFHGASSDEDEDFEDGFSPVYDDSSSSEDSEHIHFPFFPPFLVPPPHLLMTEMFPLGNPFQIMFELQRFQTQMNREHMRIKRAEERNRKRQLGSIATTSFSTSQNLNEKQCVICLEEFEEGTELKRLSCKHHYHVACIDKWLIQNGKCPLCNSKAVNTLEEVQNKFVQAKRLRENAQKRMRRRPHNKQIKKRRQEEIQKNPANPAGRKIKSIKKRGETSPIFLRRQSPSFPLPIFGGMIPPLPQPSFGGAMDSDDEEEQIQRAIRESLKEAEERDKKDKELS